MTGAPRRRRAVVLLGLSLAAGGLAASEVARRTSALEERVGSPVDVVVAARELAAGRRLRAGDLRVERVPARFAPPDGLADPGAAVGATAAAAVVRGGFVTVGVLGGGGERRPGGPAAPRRGERALELAVAGGAALESSPPGSRVDVIVTTAARNGPGRTFAALEDVELLALRPASEGGAGAGGGENGAAAAASGRATLLVTARQAVYLTAAQSFAREIRLLPRPPGDRGRIGRAVVGEGL